MSDLETFFAPLLEADPTPSNITEVRVISSESYEVSVGVYDVILECELINTGQQFEYQYYDDLTKKQAETLVGKLPVGAVLDIDLKYWM